MTKTAQEFIEELNRDSEYQRMRQEQARQFQHLEVLATKSRKNDLAGIIRDHPKDDGIQWLKKKYHAL